jgi:AcrR family transcriptional regulator
VSEESVFAVTAELLSEMRLRDISIEEIARRAGVGKATIYRWWPSKAHVALDAFMKLMRTKVNVPDTGSMSEDLMKQLRSVIRFYTNPAGSIIKQFLAEGQSNPDFGEVFLQRFLESRREETRLMWERGLSRGELDPSINIDVAMDLVYDPVMFRIMTGHVPSTTTRQKQ